MSRVFEALTRGAQENKEIIPRALKKVESDEKFILREGRSPDSPADFRPTTGVHSKLGRWSNSWRERVEELFSGWDLKGLKSHPLVALERDSAVADQFRILRTQVKKFRSETGARCLSVTSPVKQDGKTMVAVNLAASLALDYEEKVLLIDGDLRSSEVHRYFGMQPTSGLADYLSSNFNSDPMHYVHETFLPGLRILPAGKSSDLSSELVAKDRMKNLMEEIRSRFPGHQIIIDTPPVLLTPDPLILSAYVDGIIVVVRAHRTSREYLLKAIQSLNSGKVMGIVLNGTEMGLPSKKYSYATKKA